MYAYAQIIKWHQLVGTLKARRLGFTKAELIDTLKDLDNGFGVSESTAIRVIETLKYLDILEYVPASDEGPARLRIIH
jgi:hypothetical protein